MLTFEAGPRRYPVAFAGPFLVEVFDLTENVPHATGSVSIVARALGLAPAVTGFQGGMGETVSITEVSGPAGRSLNADEGVRFWGTPAVAGSYLVTRASVDLRNLLRDVRLIEHLRGELSISFASDVFPLRWEQGETGSKPVAGDRALELVEWGTYTRFQMEVEPDGVDRYEVRFAPLDGSGKPLGTLMSDSSGWGSELSASLQTPEVPGALDIRVCARERATYAFDLRDIPLAHHAAMPEALTPLAFEGAAPLTVEFLDFGERGEGEMAAVRAAGAERLEQDGREPDGHLRVPGRFRQRARGLPALADRRIRLRGPGAPRRRGRQRRAGNDRLLRAGRDAAHPDPRRHRGLRGRHDLGARALT